MTRREFIGSAAATSFAMATEVKGGVLGERALPGG